MSYVNDREWSDEYLPEIKRIVGPRLLVESPDEIDRQQAADLIVLTARDLTVGCRIRRPEYWPKYRGQFTIRLKRDSGARTEFDKIVSGWGDWMFYGFTIDAPHPAFAEWYLIDLKAFRAHLIRRQLRCGDVSNGDGTHFRWFDVDSFPAEPSLLVDSFTMSPEKDLALF